MQLQIDRLLKLSQDQQSSELRYYSRCPPEIRISILENKTQIFHKFRQENSDVDKAIVEYCALILAISAQHTEEQSLSNKSYTGMTLEEIRAVSDKKASLFLLNSKKQAKQRERTLTLWADIRVAKLDHGMSFRKIVIFLKKKHRFEVSRSLINVMWHEIEENKLKEQKCSMN
ncbi:MAG: hypothetical protein Q8M39_05555 [Sulfuricurvum sp.]|nr:hypothetical protein [Sulfuricurvum sp.]